MSSHSGFTLIELMIVMTIIFLLSMVGTIPYNRMMEQEKVRQQGQKIEQWFKRAQTYARVGYRDSAGKPQDITVTLSTGSGKVDIVAQ